MSKYNYKTTVDECLQLDMTKLSKFMNPDKPVKTSWRWRAADGVGKYEAMLTLNPYHITIEFIDGYKNFDPQGFFLEKTQCNYGGSRYWLMCPCGNRVRKLYSPHGYYHFACRECHNLGYLSQSINRHHPHASDMKATLVNKRIRRLKNEIKTPYYKGKPTRKQKLLLKLKAKQETLPPSILAI